MVKLKLPVLSAEASGTFGKSITFSRQKNKNYAKIYTISDNPQSPKQTNIRTAYSLIIGEWNKQSAVKKEKWDDVARPLELTALNHFISRGMTEYKNQLGISTTPTSVHVTGNPPTEKWHWS